MEREAIGDFAFEFFQKFDELEALGWRRWREWDNMQLILAQPFRH
jgi:hypothetical protein